MIDDLVTYLSERGYNFRNGGYGFNVIRSLLVKRMLSGTISEKIQIAYAGTDLAGLMDVLKKIETTDILTVEDAEGAWTWTSTTGITKSNTFAHDGTYSTKVTSSVFINAVKNMSAGSETKPKVVTFWVYFDSFVLNKAIHFSVNSDGLVTHSTARLYLTTTATGVNLTRFNMNVDSYTVPWTAGAWFKVTFTLNWDTSVASLDIQDAAGTSIYSLGDTAFLSAQTESKYFQLWYSSGAECYVDEITFFYWNGCPIAAQSIPVAAMGDTGGKAYLIDMELKYNG